MEVYLKYGNYSHPSGQTVVTISRQVTHDAYGSPQHETQIWQIAGRMEADTQAALTTALQALDAAYSVDRYDIGLYLEDGTPTAHRLLSGSTITGTLVTNRPEYPTGEGAQYSSYRDYRITVQGTIPIINVPGGESLISSQETLEITGDGGASFVVREQLVGLPIAYQVKQRTKTTATQAGYAEGYGKYPFAAQPFNNLWLKRELSRVKYIPPARTYTGASSKQVFRVEWTYLFESPGSLGNPNF